MARRLGRRTGTPTVRRKAGVRRQRRRPSDTVACHTTSLNSSEGGPPLLPHPEGSGLSLARCASTADQTADVQARTDTTNAPTHWWRFRLSARDTATWSNSRMVNHPSAPALKRNPKHRPSPDQHQHPPTTPWPTGSRRGVTNQREHGTEATDGERGRARPHRGISPCCSGRCRP